MLKCIDKRLFILRTRLWRETISNSSSTFANSKSHWGRRRAFEYADTPRGYHVVINPALPGSEREVLFVLWERRPFFRWWERSRIDLYPNSFRSWLQICPSLVSTFYKNHPRRKKRNPSVLQPGYGTPTKYYNNISLHLEEFLVTLIFSLPAWPEETSTGRKYKRALCPIFLLGAICAHIRAICH